MPRAARETEVPPPGEVRGNASSAAGRRPFARRRAAVAPTDAEGHRGYLPYEGRTDEATFRAVAARDGCEVVAVGKRLEARAGLLLMARLDVATGRGESRHPYPAARLPEAPGRFEVEVRDAPGPDGLSPALVRWRTRGTGTADQAVVRVDVEAFAAAVAACGNVVVVTGHDGSRSSVAAVERRWGEPAARRGAG